MSKIKVVKLKYEGRYMSNSKEIFESVIEAFKKHNVDNFELKDEIIDIVYNAMIESFKDGIKVARDNIEKSANPVKQISE